MTLFFFFKRRIRTRAEDVPKPGLAPIRRRARHGQVSATLLACRNDFRRKMKKMLVALLLCALAAVGTLGSGGVFRIEAMKSKHEFLREGLGKRGWTESKKVGSQIAPGLLWTWHFKAPSANCLVNHFENHESMTTKSGLLDVLMRSQTDASSWMPRGLLWPRDGGLIAMDFHRTKAACRGGSSRSDGSPLLAPLQSDIDCGPRTNGTAWIAKPATGARGVGIAVFDELLVMQRWLSQQQSGAFVIQKYVETPLLIHGRKFDIRLFVLVTSLDPLVVFCSSDAYVRFASAPFADAATSDLFAHLTNHQIQKLAPPVEGDEERGVDHNQWPLSTLRKHLNGAWDLQVVPQIKDLVAEALLAWPDRDRNHRNASFELLGLDIMLSESLQPYLLEINADPGLHVTTDTVKNHHQRAIEGLLQAVIDRRSEWTQHAKCEPGQCTPGVSIDPWEMMMKV